MRINSKSSLQLRNTISILGNTEIKFTYRHATFIATTVLEIATVLSKNISCMILSRTL